MAVTIWHHCNFHDRPLSMGGIGAIPTMPIISMCELYNATKTDFQKILDIEKILFPAIKNAEPETKKDVKG